MTEIFTLFGLLAFGTAAFWGFWVTLFVVLCVLVGLTENEKWGYASGIIVVGFIFLAQMHIFNIVHYANTHLANLIWFVVKYIGIGVIWGLFKWVRFVYRKKGQYKSVLNSFLKEQNATELNDELRFKWNTKLNGYGQYISISAIPPVASENKEKIINWMAFWPFSMLGTLLNDFLTEVWNAIYDSIGGTYDKIARAIYKDVSGDILSKDQLEALRVGKKTSNNS